MTDSGAASRSAESDWALARDNLLARPSRWGTLSWISAKALIDSVNHGLDRFSDGLVPQLREQWVQGAPVPPLRIVERPDDRTFMIIGDTGEQDASQYVVCPSLSAAVRDHEPGFVMVASDVIYPAGDVDDYFDGVYRPYRSPDPHFAVAAPLLGLPGNHDWYDGLAGFMYHFANQDRLAAEAYAPLRSTPRAVLGRLSRILWRRARPPRIETQRLHASDQAGWANPLTRTVVQPGPYYAVRTKHLLLVAIDTGIDGHLDRQQWDWLTQVSGEPGPKVLVTGKPLLVNAKLQPCWVGPTPKNGVGDSVWDLVNRPEHRYVATIGGDVHNFQKYVPGPAPGPQLHLVSGGGGAFMHATHPYANADFDSRARNNPRSSFYDVPQESFPTRNQSVRHFAELLVPGVVRIMGRLLLFVAGVLTGGIGGWLDPGPGLWYAQVVTAVAVALLLALVVIRSVRRKRSRSSALARRVVSVGAFAVGVLAASAGFLLDPVHYQTYQLVWLALTVLHCVVNALVRRSGWWRPADEFNRNPNPVTFGLGVLVLSGLVFALLLILDADRRWGWPLVGALLIIIPACVGWVARRRRFTVEGIGPLDDATKTVLGRRNRRWHIAGAILLPGVQAAVFAIGLHQLAESVDRPWLFWGAALGLVVTAVIMVAAALALIVVTELAALVARLRFGWTARGYRQAWGVVAGITHHLMVPLLLSGTALAIWWADGPTSEAAVGLPLVLFTVAGYLIGVVWLRPRIGSAYLPVAILVPVALAALAYAFDPWWARVGLGTAIIVLALGVSVVLGHLAFLGAQLLLVTPGALQPPRFTDEEIEAIFAARRAKPRPLVPDVPKNVLLWFRLTSPGLGEPGGLLQQKVAEIFSSDQPPFYKGFLRLDTTETELSITLHQVFGETPATTIPVATLPLTGAATVPAD